MIFSSSELLNTFENEVENVTDSIILISAFSKLSTLQYVDKKLKNSVNEKKILLRWKLEDLLTGATDISIYEFCKRRNWTLYVNLDLHAKIYIFNRVKCIIGSSNLTNRGLSINQHGNIEINTLMKIGQEEENEILNLLNISYKMNDYMYKKMLSIYDESLSKSSKKNWEEDILLEIKNNHLKFWSYELISSHNPKNLDVHDKNLLNIKNINDLKEIKRAFVNSKIFEWVQINVEEFEYFGTLTKKLHNDLLDDPSIYRMNVKKYLTNIFNWIEVLEIERFKIDRPKYSQRIRRINNEFDTK